MTSPVSKDASTAAEESTWNIFKSVKREINLLTSFHHPNIIKLLGYSIPEMVTLKTKSEVAALTNGVYLVYELSSHGSLDKLLSDDTLAGKLTWRRRMMVALHLASAISYLHSHNKDTPALHRDIKSANVCLDGETYTTKLIDCGLSKYHQSSDKIHVSKTDGAICVGTPAYTDIDYPSSILSDMFSYGIVVLELLTGKLQLVSDVEIKGKKQKVNFKLDKFQTSVPVDPRTGDWLPECASRLREIAIRYPSFAMFVLYARVSLLIFV